MWKSLFWEHFNRLKWYLVALHDTYESTGVESTAVSANAITKVQITLWPHSPGFSQCKVICQIPQNSVDSRSISPPPPPPNFPAMLCNLFIVFQFSSLFAGNSYLNANQAYSVEWLAFFFSYNMNMRS